MKPPLAPSETVRLAESEGAEPLLIVGRRLRVMLTAGLAGAAPVGCPYGDLQDAAVDGRTAGVGIGAGEGQHAAAELGQAAVGRARAVLQSLADSDGIALRVEDGPARVDVVGREVVREDIGRSGLKGAAVEMDGRGIAGSVLKDRAVLSVPPLRFSVAEPAATLRVEPEACWRRRWCRCRWRPR